MNTQGSLARYILVVLCISIVFTTLVLIALNAWTTNNKLSLMSLNTQSTEQPVGGRSYEDGYRAGYNAAREKLKNKPPIIGPSFYITGQIVSIGNNLLTVKETNLDTDEIVDGVSDIRTVNITTSTKIVLRQQIDQKTFQSQMNDWQKSSHNTPPPLPFTEKNIAFSDLKVDHQVSVRANEDIRLADKFDALQVVVNDKE